MNEGPANLAGPFVVCLLSLRCFSVVSLLFLYFAKFLNTYGKIPPFR